MKKSEHIVRDYLNSPVDISSASLKKSLKACRIELEKSRNELKLAREEAVWASQKYSELYDFSPSGYLTLSTSHKIIEINQSGCEILGSQNKLLTGTELDKYISPETRDVLKVFYRNISESRSREFCEVIVDTDGNQLKNVFIEGRVRLKSGEMLLNLVDITEARMVEQTLLVSEKKYRTMLNASPDGMLVIDPDGKITEVSEIGMQLLGSELKEDVISRHIADFVPPEEQKVITEMIEKTINEGLTQNMEVIIRRTNQTFFPGEMSSTLIQDTDGSPLLFMIIIRDISERKKTEAKQMHADRMANLGEMASGIAHEINQPLNIISMVLDKILLDGARNKKIDVAFLNEKSERIFENIIRIRNIIDHIRAFSGNHDDYVLTNININSSIEGALSMTSEQFRHLGIDLRLNLEKDLPLIYGNTCKFEQVIVNLLVNAKDAVLEKKCSGADYTGMMISISSYTEKKSVIVEVADNGIGIKDDDIHNVILPFYTTKDEGKGTGLGLSICYQIIKELNGTIDIISTQSAGTKIRISLSKSMT